MWNIIIHLSVCIHNYKCDGSFIFLIINEPICIYLFGMISST